MAEQTLLRMDDAALRSMLETALGQQYEILRPLGHGGMGAVYLAAAVILGGVFVYRALKLWRGADPAESMRLFKFSILYLALLFAAVAADAVLPIARLN